MDKLEGSAIDMKYPIEKQLYGLNGTPILPYGV